MPSEIEIYGDTVLFGIRVMFRSNDKRTLDAALALYPVPECAEVPDTQPSIYVVLKSYDVNPCTGSVHCVEGMQLAVDVNGNSARADGKLGRGFCNFAGDASDDARADLINTVVLFLVAHAGRVPLHASAVMLDGIAVVFAGPSGSGKSTLALAASRTGLPVLSDDTIFVQTMPHFRIWSLGGPIHVFVKDAPPGLEGGLRLRGGRTKRVLPLADAKFSAERTILCLLARGDHAALEPLSPADAAEALTASPEPGYEFYGAQSAVAAGALAQGGAWRLTLSNDPAEAIALVRRTFATVSKPGGISFHRDYVRLVADIERRFPVAQWKSRDVDLWPLARFDLYLDMYWDNAGLTPPAARPWLLRVAAHLLNPLRNLWRSRRDLAHWVALPRPAQIIFLGDGVSLDRIDGVFQDRCGEPLFAACERRRQSIFIMQDGDLSRLPWRRPTFTANIVAAWGWLISSLFVHSIQVPRHQEVLNFLAARGVSAPSLALVRLARRARIVCAAAYLFEGVLKLVRPKLAFVVSYYAGLGPAFVLACRRLGILSVDLQHAPLAGAPMAYSFSVFPDQGYSTLPALFWTWSEQETDAIRRGQGDMPWHQSFSGFYPQSPILLQDEESAARAWDTRFGGGFEREILVALQPIDGHSAVWESLAREIETAPSNWRWWIRRHPASRPHQDVAFGRLLSLQGPNVMIDEAWSMTLPTLLRHMSVVLSLASGAAVEAAMFGVPALFLSEEAQGPFGDLIDRGLARIVSVASIQAAIAELALPDRAVPERQLDLDQTLVRLEAMADNYASSCAGVVAQRSVTA